MIAFSYPRTDTLDTLCSLCRGSTHYARVREYMSDVIAEGEDVDIAVCFCHGTFLSRRYFDGEYEFTFPLVLEDGADVQAAFCELEEYCRRYELPLIFGDLSKEECEALMARYRFCRAEELDVSDGEENADGRDALILWRLYVENECTRMDEIPTLSGERVTLSSLGEGDIASYALLCRDEEILAVWGYDYRDSAPDMTDRDFYEVALEEFERRISVTFAVRVGERLVGEAVLYAFDGRGGAEFSIRMLSGYRRMGYARDALTVLFRYASNELALSYLDGVCLSENRPSRALMAQLMTPIDERDGMVRFRRELR